MSVAVVADGLQGITRYLMQAPEAALTAARIALNYAAGGPGLKSIQTAISAEVNFPAGYVNSDRLSFVKRATNADLEASIEGRDRPTSLARFATPGQSIASSRRLGAVDVQVHRGSVRRIGAQQPGERGHSTAFLVNLANGNTGLAIRLKAGESAPRGTTRATQLDTNLFLLYGPSVNQVFSDVAEKETPPLLTIVENEFFRQFDRLTTG